MDAFVCLVELHLHFGESQLALQASDGSISLLLVPKAEQENGDARMVPSRDLIDRVAAFIDKRRLITARVNVGKPRQVPVSLELTISLKPGATADRVKALDAIRAARSTICQAQAVLDSVAAECAEAADRAVAPLARDGFALHPPKQRPDSAAAAAA